MSGFSGTGSGPGGSSKRRPEIVDEIRLLLQAKDGDAEAFSELYRRYYNDVYALCLSFGSIDADSAKDVLQEAFIRAFRSIGNLREGQKFKPWLLTIARNRALTYLGREEGLGRKHRALAHEVPAHSVPKETGGELERQIMEVRRVIEELPDGPMKDCAKSFYVEGLATPEIAQRLGIPKSTVTTRLDRFRARVRKDLLSRLLD